MEAAILLGQITYEQAVVPDLQPYQVSTINIDAPNLPLGYDLGQVFIIFYQAIEAVL